MKKFDVIKYLSAGFVATIAMASVAGEAPKISETPLRSSSEAIVISAVVGKNKKRTHRDLDVPSGSSSSSCSTGSSPIGVYLFPGETGLGSLSNGLKPVKFEDPEMNRYCTGWY